MKLIMIKIGKAVKTLQRDGFINGGRRIFKSFISLFRLVGDGQILFITGGVGDSARYRTDNVAEELKKHNFNCSITVQDNPFLHTYANKFKIFIFHRVLFTPQVERLIEEIKKQEKEIIFETDDLVYDPKYLEYMDYFKVMNSFEKKLYENGVGGEILNDSYVTTCTTTTDFLANKLRELGKKVFIVPNKLTVNDLLLAEKIKSKNIHNDSGKIRIGYFSGALSHNKDFATINEALLKIMEKYENVELYLVGPLDITNSLNKFKFRIKEFSYVPREKHFENIAKVDINIAPLEIGNPFCESKSELKFFEAGLMKIPTVAAATDPFKKAIEDGVDGFLASGNKEWFEKLEKLITDSYLRSSMGERAKEKTLKLYTTENSKNIEYYDYLRLKLK